MTGLPAGAAVSSALALLELDAASVGVTLLSRPFVAAPLIAWIFQKTPHDAANGFLFGVCFEALTLEELPLGGCLHLSAPIAAGVSSWLAVERVPLELAFLCGLGAGWVHARIERRLRRSRVVHAQRAEGALGEGRDPNLGAEVSAALAVQAVATFAATFAIVVAGSTLMPRLWSQVPDACRDGARVALFASPFIGAGGLLASQWRRA